MKTWIILPYDASPIAKAALSRAARAAQQSHGQAGGVILATAGVDPAVVGALVDDAQAIAGQDVPLEVRLLNPGDPITDLLRIADELPDAILSAPLGARGKAPWYAEACAHGGRGHTILLFNIEREDLREFEEERHERHRVDGLGAAVLRACARLRLGVRPHLKAAKR